MGISKSNRTGEVENVHSNQHWIPVRGREGDMTSLDLRPLPRRNIFQFPLHDAIVWRKRVLLSRDRCSMGKSSLGNGDTAKF